MFHLKKKDQIKKFIEYLHPDNETFEFCTMKPETKKSAIWGDEKVYGKEIVAGWFDDREKVANLAKQLKEVKPQGVYLSLNPCMQALTGRANGRLKANVNRTRDDEILRIKNFFVDIDPVRPSGTSSSKKEHKVAIKVAKRISIDMKKQGWPTPLRADSGNGAHLIYKIDLENNEQNVGLIKGVLHMLADKYNSPKVKIDEQVFNPGRLVKLPGTYARKGEDLPERPHRKARILKIPKIAKKLTLKRMKSMLPAASDFPETDKENTSAAAALLDVKKYLKHYDIELGKVKTCRGGNLFVLKKCLFNEDHAPNEAAIYQSSEGTLYYQCFHNSCLNKKWDDARQIISGNDKLEQFLKYQKGDASNNYAQYSLLAGSELIQQPVKEELLIKGLLEKNGSLLIIGQTGMMKSMLTLNMALTLASARENDRLWGLFDIPTRAKTLFIQSENGIYGTHKRMTMMISGNKIYEKAAKRIFFPATRKDCRIVGDLQDKYFQEILKEMIFQTRANLVVFDPLISFHNHNENDNAELRKVLDTLTELSEVTKTASLLVHHAGKSSSDGVFAGRGASAIADWAGNILVLNKKDVEGDNFINVSHVKSRNFPVCSPFTLKVSGSLQFTKVESPTEIKLNIAVTALASLGGKVDDQSALKEKIIKQCSCSAATAHRTIKDAVVAGLIKEKKRGKKMSYRLIQVEKEAA